MKVENNISFGQTYLQSSIKHLSKANFDKLEYLYGLGELYPVDIFLGSTIRGDLSVGLRGCNLWDYLVLNNGVPMTPLNVMKYYLIKRMEVIGEYMHGRTFPVENHVIKNIDYKYQEDIAYEISDKIKEYIQKHSKKFMS